MIQAASSMNVRDTRTGRLLVSERFTGVTHAMEFLSVANLVCSVCGRNFGRSSTITMMNRGDWWELMLPHQCEPTAPIEQISDPAATSNDAITHLR